MKNSPSSTIREESPPPQYIPPTVGNTYPFTAEGICQIMDACGRNSIQEIHIGDLSIFSVPGEQRLYTSRKPGRSVVGAAEGVRHTEGATPERVPSRPMVAPAETQAERESLEIQAIRAQDEIEAELALTDPAAWDRHLQRLAEAAGNPVVAALQDELDEEEQID